MMSSIVWQGHFSFERYSLLFGANSYLNFSSRIGIAGWSPAPPCRTTPHCEAHTKKKAARWERPEIFPSCFLLSRNYSLAAHLGGLTRTAATRQTTSR